ncbi:MAG: acyl-CoA dehydrogenase family protein [Pikeienuella sp.]
MDFEHSAETRKRADEVRAFMDGELLPRNRDWRAWAAANAADPEWMAPLRARARAAGLWNMGLTRLPEGREGTPLSNLAFAPIAEAMGGLSWAPFIFNCHAPDLPNMITLLDEATPEQQERYLDPLLEGRMRSAFAMTEPDNGSSDARNIAMRVDRTAKGYVLNGRKWFASGAAHPDCRFLIVIGALAEAGPRSGHTAFILPMDTPGLTLTRRLNYLCLDEPIGELDFEDVEVPADALLGAEGQGFAVAQTRLGPARVHHCMRAIGLAETVLELMVARAGERRTFNRRLDEYDTVQGWIARSRVEIEQARLIVLKCAWLLDRDGHRGAWREVSIAKIAVPQMLSAVVDRALQLFGAMGGTERTPLPEAMAWARAFRIFDGPDEVHLRQIFKQEEPAKTPLAENPHICEPAPQGA